MIGATASRLAIMTPTSDIIRVKSNARFGSPSRDVTENICRNGITPSLAIACSKRGALKKKKIKLRVQFSVNLMLRKLTNSK